MAAQLIWKTALRQRVYSWPGAGDDISTYFYISGNIQLCLY